MDIQKVAHRLEDPVHYTVEEVVQRAQTRKLSLLTEVVMAHLPEPLPKWAIRLFRVGVQRELKSELKRRGYVYRDGRYQRFADLSLREAWAYVHHLEENSARDRARIKYLKAELRKAEQVAGSPESERSVGDLLGWSDEERAA